MKKTDAIWRESKEPNVSAPKLHKVVQGAFVNKDTTQTTKILLTQLLSHYFLEKN